ncbi:MAG: hypothetical protein H6695_18605 [Deferribacteres bacterium]|nr:hypothetical protein [candidate division KSB1 bacterium]MCB9512197.1 hypothetical protein [Deferribacteres bacterium]
MKAEYKIKFEMPKDYNPSDLFMSLPSPLSSIMTEIYNYSIEPYGFYFLDNLVDQKRAGYAMKLFIDEAFKYTKRVEIQKISNKS